MLVCICVEFAEICVWVCVYVGGVVDVVCVGGLSVCVVGVLGVVLSV